MAAPANIPGPHTEYPNWRRMLCKTLEEIFADEQVNKPIKDADKPPKKSRWVNQNALEKVSATRRNFFSRTASLTISPRRLHDTLYSYTDYFPGDHISCC